MQRFSLNTLRLRAAEWLCQGITPRRLAFTLALGLAMGCFPILGVTTLACALLAMALRLNMPAIQAANYAAFPFQLALLVPFVRLGSRLLLFAPGRSFSNALLRHASSSVARIGLFTEEALLAWLIVAIPAVALLTFLLTPLLRRIPAVAAEQTVD